MTITTVTAEGGRLDLVLRRGAEFVIDLWEDVDGTLTSLANTTIKVYFRKGTLEDPSSVAEERFDYSARVSVLSSDPIGNNVVMRLSLTPTDVNAFEAQTSYCWACTVQPSGGQPREFLRGQVTVVEAI